MFSDDREKYLHSVIEKCHFGDNSYNLVQTKITIKSFYGKPRHFQESMI